MLKLTSDSMMLGAVAIYCIRLQPSLGRSADQRMTPDGPTIHRTDDGGKAALSFGLGSLTREFNL